MKIPVACAQVVCTVALLLPAVLVVAATPGPDATDRAPWRAPSAHPLVEEPRRFVSAGVTLAGTLYLPRDRPVVGAIVVAHGASSPLRTSPLYAHLTRMLPPLGIAVFVYDRRGSGESGGDLRTSDYTVLADDAIAAVASLRQDRRIDPERIGMWGLSQGGWISLLAATRSSDVKFAVSISAPVVTPDVQMMFSTTNAMRVNGYSSDDIAQMQATREAVDDYMRGTESRERAQRLLDAAQSAAWFKFTYMGPTFADRATSRWRKEIEYDPLRVVGDVRVPTLVLFGSDDPVVPVAESVDRLRTLQPARPNIETHVVTGADHSMQIGVDPKDLLDPALADAARPDSAEYIAVFAAWLARHGLSQ